jgi:hypothetical protein
MRSPVALRLMLASLLSVTALSCTGTAIPTGAPTVAPGTSEESTTDAPDSEPGNDAEGFEPPARPEPAPDPLRPGACDATTAGAIGATVSAQLEAFTREDIASAYGLTSPFFQRMLDVEAFETMIRTEYPYLLESSGHRLDECWARGRRGYILAGVRAGSRETVLRYDVSDEPGLGWRIDGAAALPGISLPPDRLV